MGDRYSSDSSCRGLPSPAVPGRKLSSSGSTKLWVSSGPLRCGSRRQLVTRRLIDIDIARCAYRLHAQAEVLTAGVEFESADGALRQLRHRSSNCGSDPAPSAGRCRQCECIGEVVAVSAQSKARDVWLGGAASARHSAPRGSK